MKNNFENGKHINCYCSDCSIAPQVVVQHPETKLWGIVEMKVLGMGNADLLYNQAAYIYDEVRSYNTNSGLSFVAFRKGNRWALQQIKSNDNYSSFADAHKIEFISGFDYNTYEEVLGVIEKTFD